MLSVNHSIITRQRQLLIDSLSDLISRDTPYALLDFPSHSNVGDSAIWLGEIAILKQITGRLPAYGSTAAGFKLADLVSACPEGPIFVHGGGNFGDIWPSHQGFREHLLSTLRERHIIQLPQSIKFRDVRNIPQCAKAVSEHPNYTLLVRDRQSESFAADQLNCVARLLPDGALGLGPLAKPTEPTHDFVLLLRTDDEKRGYDLSAFAGLANAVTLDWLDEPRGTSMRIAIAARISAALQLRGRQHADLRYFNTVASHRVERGLRMLAGGRMVITDRLHAHILSFLLDLPHVSLDNDYGKISGYIDAWDHASPLVQKATSPSEAVEKLSMFENVRRAG